MKGQLPEEQFQLVADAISEIEDASLRGAIAQKVLGRAGRQLLPMFKNLAELRKEAADLGLKPSPESIKAAADITDAFNRVRRVVSMTVFEIGASVASMAERIASATVKVVSDLKKWIVENRRLIVTSAQIGAALLAVGSTIAGVGTAVLGLAASLKVATIAVGLLGTVSAITASGMSLLSVAAAAVDISVLSLAAVFAVATGGVTGNAAAFTLLAAIQSAYPVVGAIVVSTLGAIGTAMASMTSLTGIDTVAAGAFSAAWTAAAGVAASAWAIIASPVTPFVVAAAAATAAVAALGAAAAFTAAKGIRFGKAWDGIRNSLSRLMGTAKQAGSVIFKALSLGEYETAFKAGMIGVRIAFWDAAQDVVEAFKFMFEESMSFAKRFFSDLIGITVRSMSAVAQAMQNPAAAAAGVAGILFELS
jgi:hypothetical protein